MNASSYLKIVEIASNLPNFSQDGDSTRLQEFKELDSHIKKNLDTCNYKIGLMITLLPDWRKLEMSIKEEKAWLETAVSSLHKLSKLVPFQKMLPHVQAYRKYILEFQFHKKELEQLRKELVQLEETHSIEIRSIRLDFEECDVLVEALEKDDLLDLDFLDCAFCEGYTRSIATITEICTKPLFLVCFIYQFLI